MRISWYRSNQDQLCSFVFVEMNFLGILGNLFVELPNIQETKVKIYALVKKKGGDQWMAINEDLCSRAFLFAWNL